MALEAYTPTDVTFRGAALDGVLVVTLYDPDGDTPRGGMTGASFEEGVRGPLVLEGRRQTGRYRVTMEEIEVVRANPLGCEFRIKGAPRREVLEAPGERG